MNWRADRGSRINDFYAGDRRTALQGIAGNLESTEMPILECNRGELLAAQHADQRGHAGNVPIVPGREKQPEMVRH